jgi:hypothetical protein
VSSEKYPVGQKLIWPGESEGVVVENFKMPGDICVKWDVMDEACSYDEWFLDEHVKKIEMAKGILLPKRSSCEGDAREK